ncbi:MAG: SRPBCC family protein [Chloroflexota bacterium]
MFKGKIRESIIVSASPQEVYHLLADYEVGHPSILPKPYFADLRVVEGGYGLGTVVDVDMNVFGVERTLNMKITEAIAGELLTEEDTTGTVTHFLFEPVAQGCKLTIDTTMLFPRTIAGFIERYSTPMITAMIFRKELALIQAHFTDEREWVSSESRS